MKSLFNAGKFLLADMASTFFFLAVFAVTHNVPLSVSLGIALGVGQIGWQLARKAPIDTMQWMSLIVVVVSGGATLLTHDPRFVMIKPSLIYCVVGAVMLKKGWMNRYLPAEAIQIVPDVAETFGFIWSGLMFASAGLNVVVALHTDPLKWAAFMSAWATGSKLALFLIQYATMRWIAGRRSQRQAMAVPA